MTTKTKDKNVCTTTGVCSYSIHAPCRDTCPISQNAPLYIRHISMGEFDKAWQTIYEDNPFGLSCGRVCQHPCELKCRAGEVGDPIAIRVLKRFASQRAKESGYKPQPFDIEQTGKKVAVVGGGPAGLTAGYYLRKKGHEVHIYESTDKVGGMLAHAIPDYRLPADELAFDLENILAAGMEIHYNKTLGRDITLRSLGKEFDAVFMAIGSWASWKLGIEGEDSPDVVRGIEFLMRVKAGEDVKTGEKVVVIGGGNVAMDVAKAALRKGAKEVDIFCLEMAHEMPAHDWEVEGAIQEGVRINNGWGPIKIAGKNNSKRVVFRKCARTYDENGKFDPRYDDSITTSCNTDQVFVAIGEHPASIIGDDDPAVHVEPWGGVTIDPDTCVTTSEGVFAGGDCVTGPKSLVEAIAAGKTAAESIDQYLNGQPVRKIYPPPPPRFKQKRKSLIRSDVLSLDRSPIHHSPPDERRSDFREIELAYSEDDAVREAKRCHECDLEPKQESKVRRFMQFSSLIAFNYYLTGFYETFKNSEAVIYAGRAKIACIPGLHCYSCPSAVTSCPIGAIQFWLNNSKNNFRLESLNLVGLYVIGFLGMVGAAVGRGACGWICPFGLFQDLMHKIPTRIKVGIPKFLKYFKYFILLFTVILIPLLFSDFGPMFCKTICPSGTLVAGIPLIAADPGLRGGLHFYFPLKMSILIALIVWMTLAKRPFCRTMCPLGAFWSFFNKHSILRIKVNNHTCDDCNSCRAVCPVDIHPQTEVQSGECIRCMNCINVCESGSLELEVAGLESAQTELERLKQANRKTGVESS